MTHTDGVDWQDALRQWQFREGLDELAKILERRCWPHIRWLLQKHGLEVPTEDEFRQHLGQGIDTGDRKEPKMSEPKAGDVVRLKSGGPRMTVGLPEKDERGRKTGRLTCHWFIGDGADNAYSAGNNYAPEALVVANDEPGQDETVGDVLSRHAAKQEITADCPHPRSAAAIPRQTYTETAIQECQLAVTTACRTFMRAVLCRC